MSNLLFIFAIDLGINTFGIYFLNLLFYAISNDILMICWECIFIAVTGYWCHVVYRYQKFLKSNSVLNYQQL